VREYNEIHFVFYFDMRAAVRGDAAFNLGLTGFVLVLLCVGSMMFTAQATHLILRPVENMMKIVEAIRDDPLIATKMADTEFNLEEKSRTRSEDVSELSCFGRLQLLVLRALGYLTSGMVRVPQQPLETVILEKTIIKLGCMLAVGFGEAGTHIIGNSMGGPSMCGLSHAINMTAGVHVECIIGIVRIRDFIVATEVLQGKIVTLVNEVAEVVHGVIDEFHGSPHKNSGDHFVTIWLLERDNPEQRTRMAEMSIVAFTKILCSIHSSPSLAKYQHPGLKHRLRNEGRVNLSLGLHFGWAIEGAIGSEMKIDASYVSPNVTVAMNVESATQVYRVPFILSRSVVELCKPPLVAKCRLIDRVAIRGALRPIQLLSMDLDCKCMVAERYGPALPSWNPMVRFKIKKFLEAEKSRKWGANVDMAELFDNDLNVRLMRQRYTLEFLQYFNMGYQNYIQGEWHTAARMLKRTSTMFGFEDGPSVELLRHMSFCGAEAPKDWDGFRHLQIPVT